MQISKYLIISYLFISPYLLSAQIDTIQMDRLDKSGLVAGKVSNEVRIVSASRSSRSIGDVPVTVEVVTREEIERNGYVTLVDVLKHVAGVRTSKPGNGIDGETFLMRGLIGNYYTKILIDNIPIQSSVTGSIAIAEQLPISQAERIEIIFGPASAIYGSDAMAGVINIITRNTDNNPFAQATISTGEYGARYMSFMAGGKAGRNKDVVRYSIYGNFSERQDLNVRYDKENYNILNTYLIPSEEKQFALQNPQAFLDTIKRQYEYYQSDGTFVPKMSNMPQRSYMIGGQMQYRNLQGSYLEMYRQTPYSLGVTGLIYGHHNPDAYYGDKTRRLTLSYNKDWEKWSMTTNLSYNQLRFNPLSSRASTYSGFNGRSYKYQASDDIFAETLLRYTTVKGREYTLGGTFQISSALPETNDLETPFQPSDYKPFSKHTPTPHPLYGTFGYNPLTFFNIGLFGQSVYVKNKWTRIFGLRLDYNSLVQNAQGIRFRGALQYKATEKLSFRVSSGSAFKAPAPQIMYASTALPGFIPNQISINYQQVPNTDLQAEVLTSLELGMRYKIGANTSLEVILYNQNTSQRINAFLAPVDTIKYPLAQKNNTVINAPLALARIYANDSNSRSTLTSLQILFKQKKLFKSWNLNIDASLTFNVGQEVLPENTGTINQYRMVAPFMGQFNIDFTPHKNWYVRLESVMSSKWYRRFITSLTINPQGDSSYDIISGYTTLDATVRYRWSKHIYTCLKVLNVFNTQYGGIDATGIDIDLRYNPQLGRNIQFGVNFNLE